MKEETTHPLARWTVESSRVVFDHPWARVRQDLCIPAPGSAPIDYLYFEGPDFAIVFAVTEDDGILLTRQYKHGIGEIVLELPAGMIDAQDESPLEGASRELREETGYGGETWTPLGVLYPSPSKSTVRAHAFLLRGARRVAPPVVDPQEAIAVVTVTADELRAMLRSGAIRDTTSLATCYLALAALGDRDEAPPGSSSPI